MDDLYCPKQVNVEEPVGELAEQVQEDPVNLAQDPVVEQELEPPAEEAQEPIGEPVVQPPADNNDEVFEEPGASNSTFVPTGNVAYRTRSGRTSKPPSNRDYTYYK